MVEPLQMQFAPRSGPIQRLWFCPIRKYIRWTSRISKGMPIFEILTPNGHIEPQGTIRAAASYSRCSTAIISVGIVMYTSSPSYRMKHNTWALLYFKGSSSLVRAAEIWPFLPLRSSFWKILVRIQPPRHFTMGHQIVISSY